MKPYFEKDPRWQGEDSDIKEYFETLADQLVFSSEVDNEIVEFFNSIQSLLALSYFEYEFLDIAFHKALQGCELGLKLRAKELKIILPENQKPFYYFPRYFAGKGIISVGFEQWDKLRKARNSSSHPKQFTLFGITTVRALLTIPGMINDLYRDPKVNISISELKNKVINILKSKIQNGAILFENESKTILWDCLVINGLSISIQEPEIGLVFQPLKNPNIQILSEYETRYEVPENMIHVSVTDIEEQNGIISFKGTGGKDIKLQSCTGIEKKTFDKIKEIMDAHQDVTDSFKSILKDHEFYLYHPKLLSFNGKVHL